MYETTLKSLYEARLRLKATADVARAASMHSVVPIYRPISDDDIEHIGSGVLIKFLERKFLITANHVLAFGRNGQALHLIEDEPVALVGTWHYSKPVVPFRDLHDFAFYHLQESQLKKMKNAKFIEHFDTNMIGETLVTTIGFPNSKNNMSRRKYKSKDEFYKVTSTPYAYTNFASIEREHIRQEMKSLRVRNTTTENIEKLPSLHGISGGAMFAYDNFLNPKKALLSGINIEFFKEKIVAVRMKVVLAAISQALF